MSKMETMARKKPRPRRSFTTGVSCSGSFGGRSFAIGDTAISSSSTSQAKNCCSARNRTLAVEAERVASRCVMKSETCSRETSAAVVTPLPAR
jgi:hypothetical protein